VGPRYRARPTAHAPHEHAKHTHFPATANRDRPPLQCRGRHQCALVRASPRVAYWIPCWPRTSFSTGPGGLRCPWTC